jgi:hypothetical protein
MAEDRREAPTFLSTSVVARLLRLSSADVRNLIEARVLPEPDWMLVGERRERIYSLEWLALATERVNGALLPGFEEWIRPPNGAQVVVRFDKPAWELGEVSSILAGLTSLWAASYLALDPGAAPDGQPPLIVRRLSAGSPLDILLWVRDAAGSGVSVAAIATLVHFVLRHPDDVVGAIPRMIASWHTGWANVNKAKLDRLQSSENLKRFQEGANSALAALGDIPRETSASGDNVTDLTPPQQMIETPRAGPGVAPLPTPLKLESADRDTTKADPSERSTTSPSDA